MSAWPTNEEGIDNEEEKEICGVAYSSADSSAPYGVNRFADHLRRHSGGCDAGQQLR